MDHSQLIDLLAYYCEHLDEAGRSERRDPDFCRIALQLCRDLPHSGPEDIRFLESALFSVLKQARWSRKGLGRFLGPAWLNYDMAHSSLGPSRDRDIVLQLAASVARTAIHYQTQLFSDHSSASYNQRQFKVAILHMCIAIDRGMTQSYLASMPHLSGPQA